ncbi:MAG TPA: hypothetical protein VFY17_03070 [Pilimelia sp.]|nr:hypothetical protein [Pilimelia sp.]
MPGPGFGRWTGLPTVVAFFAGVLLTALLCGVGALVVMAVDGYRGDRSGHHQRYDRGGDPGDRREWRDWRDHAPQQRHHLPPTVPPAAGGAPAPTP